MSSAYLNVIIFAIFVKIMIIDWMEHHSDLAYDLGQQVLYMFNAQSMLRKAVDSV